MLRALVRSAVAAAVARALLFGLRLLRHEGWYVSDGPAEDESMDVVCAFVCVHGLQVHHVADHVVLVRYAVASYENKYMYVVG